MWQRLLPIATFILYNFVYTLKKKGHACPRATFKSFELAMHDSHPSLNSTKTLYHFYISDTFW